MPDFTTRRIQYPLPGDKVKDGAFVAKLADDIKQLALTSDTALNESESALDAIITQIATSALQHKPVFPSTNVLNWHGIENMGIYRFPGTGLIGDTEGLPDGVQPGQLISLPVGSTTSTLFYIEFGPGGRTFEITVSSDPSLRTDWILRTNQTRFGTALTSAQGGGVTTATNVGHALPYTPGARVDFWRLHFRNYNDRSGAHYTGPVDFFGISVGEMQRTADGKPWGTWNGVKKNIVPGGVASTPGSSEFITPWVTDFPLEAAKDYVFRYGYTCPPQNNHLAQGGGWSLTGGSAGMNDDTPAMTQVKESPLDVWIEGYSASGAKIIAVNGDSLSLAHSGDLPVYDAPINKLARANGGHAMFYAHSGTAYSEWTNPLAQKFHKYNNDVFYKMTQPTVLYEALGSNDIFSTGVTLADMIARFKVTLPLIKAKTTQSVVFMTVLPRHDASDPQEAVRKQWNAWLMDNAASYGLFVVDVASAVDDGSGSKLDLRWAASSTDIHLNTAGYARIAAMLAGSLTMTTGSILQLDTDGVPYF